MLLLLLFACQDPKGSDLDENPTTTTTEPTTPDPDPDGPLEVSELVVVEVEDNVLICRVKVNTSKDATASVQFGPADEGMRWRATSEAGLSHDVLLVGMQPDRDYDIQVTLTAGDEVVETETASFTTGTPPDHIVPAEILIHDADKVWDGWNLQDLNHQEGAPATAVIFDMEGYPVWYHVMDGGNVTGGLDVQLTPRNTVLIGGSVDDGERPVELDFDGTVLWEGPEQVGFYDDGYMHHHIDMLENGNYLLLEKVFVDDVRGDVIREVNADVETVWSWDTFDWLEPNWNDPDWTHSNWAHIADGFVYLSVRHENAIYKIDYDSGEVVWRLGEGGDFTLTDGTPWFEWQHAPKILENGNVLVYDNLGDNRIARVVEYALDEDAMTAEVYWQYGGDNEEGWISEFWGDVDRLPNGNTLITAGANKVSSIFEVTEDKELIFWLEHPNEETEEDNTMYRSNRITLPNTEPL